MADHFNRSLSPSPLQNWRGNKIVKAKLKLTLRFTMTATDGSGKHVRYPIKIICRADIERAHDWAAEHSSQRDYLVFRIIMKVGLRTLEVCTLRVEHIDCDSCHIRVLDSKKHKLLTLPQDIGTAELLRSFIGNKTHGILFTQATSWKYCRADTPLTTVTVWRIIHEIGLAVGVPNLNPRMLRDYCAIYLHEVASEKVSLVDLQGILRHEDFGSTGHYLKPMHTTEDLDLAYHKAMDGHYFNPAEACEGCSAFLKCERKRLMPWFATGCAFKPQIRKEMR